MTKYFIYRIEDNKIFSKKMNLLSDAEKELAKLQKAYCQIFAIGKIKYSRGHIILIEPKQFKL